MKNSRIAVLVLAVAALAAIGYSATSQKSPAAALGCCDGQSCCTTGAGCCGK